MKVFEIYDRLNFGKYKGGILKDIIMKDSGYIKDLIFLNETNPGFILSMTALELAQEITQGYIEKKELQQDESCSVFAKIKAYAIPYDYDFNNEELVKKNIEKLMMAKK